MSFKRCDSSFVTLCFICFQSFTRKFDIHQLCFPLITKNRVMFNFPFWNLYDKIVIDSSSF